MKDEISNFSVLVLPYLCFLMPVMSLCPAFLFLNSSQLIFYLLYLLFLALQKRANMTSLRPLSSGGLLARLALGWCQEHEFLEGSHHFLTDKSGRTYTVQTIFAVDLFPLESMELWYVLGRQWLCGQTTVKIWVLSLQWIFESLMNDLGNESPDRQHFTHVATIQCWRNLACSMELYGERSLGSLHLVTFSLPFSHAFSPCWFCSVSFCCNKS